MKTGVLGGTFNPVHNSHLYIAGEYKRALGLDRVLFVPTFTPPHKPAGELAAAGDRLAMLELALKGRPGYELCDYEARKPEKSYTYKTLEYLSATNPSDKLHFLMGADMFLTVQNWKYPERIYAKAILCAAAREEGELHELEKHKLFLKGSGAECIVIQMEPKPMSSTEIRKMAALGQDIGAMTPPGVAEYIKAHGLYLWEETDA